MGYPLTEENFGINSQEKEILRLQIEIARIKGEFYGFCKGLLWWDVPTELKSKIKEQIKQLEG